MSEAVPIPEAAIAEIRGALKTFPLEEMRDGLAPMMVEGVLIAAPHIDRAARIDELKRWVEKREMANQFEEPISVVLVEDLEARIAELEGEQDG